MKGFYIKIYIKKKSHVFKMFTSSSFNIDNKNMLIYMISKCKHIRGWIIRNQPNSYEVVFRIVFPFWWNSLSCDEIIPTFVIPITKNWREKNWTMCSPQLLSRLSDKDWRPRAPYFKFEIRKKSRGTSLSDSWW